MLKNAFLPCAQRLMYVIVADCGVILCRDTQLLLRGKNHVVSPKTATIAIVAIYKVLPAGFIFNRYLNEKLFLIFQDFTMSYFYDFHKIFIFYFRIISIFFKPRFSFHLINSYYVWQYIFVQHIYILNFWQSE